MEGENNPSFSIKTLWYNMPWIINGGVDHKYRLMCVDENQFSIKWKVKREFSEAKSSKKIDFTSCVKKCFKIRMSRDARHSRFCVLC